MLKKYNQFINESTELIIESNVVFSDKFRKVLSKIDHPISQKLKEIENNDYPISSNYLDVKPESNDKVTFIPDRKAQEILNDKTEYVRYTGGGGYLKHDSEANKPIFDRLGYKTESVPYKPTSGDIGKIVSKSKSTISENEYALIKFIDSTTKQEKGESVINTNNLVKLEPDTNLVWTRNRQDLGIGRAIRGILTASGEKVLDKDLEIFVNLYKSTIDKLNDKFSLFDLVSGDDISFWYNKKNYYLVRGTLGNSCMSSAPPDWLEIYTDNPDKCNLLILKSKDDNSKIVGRSLLWTLEDGKKFLDRIYTIEDSDVQLFKDYCKKEGWYYKYLNNSSNDNSVISPNDEKVQLELTIHLNSRYDNFPYLDTLKYYYPSGRKLSYKLDNSLEFYTLEDTSGDYVSRCNYCDGEGWVNCDECDGEGNRECVECDGEGKIECSRCDGDGDVKCDECDGEGEIEGENGEMEKCYNCSGKGKTDCKECDGEGKIECSRCDGDGELNCRYCDEGKVDCPECQ